MQAVTEPVIDLIESAGELGVGALLAPRPCCRRSPPRDPAVRGLRGCDGSARPGARGRPRPWEVSSVRSSPTAWCGARHDRLLDLVTALVLPAGATHDLNRGHRFFAKHGRAVVFFGRFIPLAWSVVSVPAGIERMLAAAAAPTAAGVSWNALFIAAGHQLGENYAVIEQWIAPWSTVSSPAAGLCGSSRRRRAVDGESSDVGAQRQFEQAR